MSQEKQMYVLKWTNSLGLELKLTHQFVEDVYKFGEMLLSEGKEITICQMS
jgi:hypothetical protein